MILGIMGNPAKPRFAPECLELSFVLLRERKIEVIYTTKKIPLSIQLNPPELVEHDKLARDADIVYEFWRRRHACCTRLPQLRLLANRFSALTSAPV